MQRILPSLIKFAVCATLALVAVQAADATGTWTWTVPARGGQGQDRKMTLKLKQDGEKLTGKLTAPGRQGATTETDIEDGKVKGEDVSFSVSREGQNGKITTKYAGKLSGDSIKGKAEGPGRGGEVQARDWEAKRDK